MWRQIILICLMIVLVGGVVVLASITYLEIGNKPKETMGDPDVRPLLLPAELSSGFDPTKDEPVFRITAINRETNNYDLQYVWTKERAGKNVVAAITCPMWDMKLRYLANDRVRRVPADKLMAELEKYSASEILVSGLC